VGRLSDAVTKRIAELIAQKSIVLARADVEIAAVQEQIDTLMEIDAALAKEPGLEDLYLKALPLRLGLPQE
jgi:hypothetical protein